MIEARLFAYRLLEELERDLPFLDFASNALPRVWTEACVVAKQNGVVAGVEEAVEFLRLLQFDVLSHLPDGSEVERGAKVLCFGGLLPDVLKVERTLLNVLTHASGIATLTRRIVERVKAANPKCRVAATRKTLPFLRYLEKKAVLLGGGDPHRLSLSDAVMFKDNHLARMTLEEAARAYASFAHRREVEVSSAEDAVRAAKLGFDVVMLDNVSPEEAARADRLLREEGLRDRVVLEASGGIGEENAHLYAPYVDVVSIGRLTHSAPALDMSLELSPKVPVGILGYGRLGRAVAALVEKDDMLELAAVYDVDPAKCAEAGRRCASSVDELVAKSFLVIEAASAEAVLQHGCKILEAGRHLVAASAGALSRLRCERQRGMLFVPSGAVGGLDLVAAVGGTVRHRASKYAVAEEASGPAGELYWRFPRNLNASVALSMAAGRDAYVELKKGGQPGYNIHEVEVEHEWGRAYIRVENKAEGPTSHVAALSVYQTAKSAVLLLTGRARVVVGTFKALGSTASS
ncbi:MAG: carboxylating nicotinate-nucleotide diphosphorylase [Pyrobaculum sp.]